MKKRIIAMIVVCWSLFLGSCGLIFDEEAHEENQIKAIVSALQSKEKGTLKSLFSKKALVESGDIDSQLDDVFCFVEGDIISWEKKDGESGSTSSGDEGTITMLRYSFDILTDVDRYSVFLIDYAVNSVDSDNEGLYMMEVHRASYDGEWSSWQERMRAGISIIQEDKGTVSVNPK